MLKPKVYFLLDVKTFSAVVPVPGPTFYYLADGVAIMFAKVVFLKSHEFLIQILEY